MKNNPVKTYIQKAVSTKSKMDDCCYICDEFIEAGSEVVAVTLFAPNVSFFGRSVNVHMHEDCWKKVGKYPPLSKNPIQANPALVIECKLITKKPSLQNYRCQYCGKPVEPGKKCLAIRFMESGFGSTGYIHENCWEKAGRYPPIYMPKGEYRKLPQGPQMKMELNPQPHFIVTATGRLLTPPLVKGKSASAFGRSYKSGQKWLLDETKKEMDIILEKAERAHPGRIGNREVEAARYRRTLAYAVNRNNMSQADIEMLFDLLEGDIEHQANPQGIVDKRPAKFREMADNLQKQIDDKRSPAIASQNLTARRARIASSMSHDADVLEKIQQSLRNIADAIDAGTLPESLKKVNSKSIVEELIYGYRRLESPLTEDEFTKAKEDIQKYVSGPSKEIIQERQKRELISSLIGTKIPGFFPTPEPVVDTMLQMAIPLTETMKVLEPSAGKGDIADALRNRFNIKDLTLVEFNYNLCKILEAKGYQPICKDFLEYNEGRYSRIIMNPPFDRGQDMDHIRHAYDLLEYGGKLVSVVSTGPFFRNDKKSLIFRAWLTRVNAKVTKLSKGSFTGAKAFRQTGVATNIILITKPVQSIKDKKFQKTVDQMMASAKVHNDKFRKFMDAGGTLDEWTALQPHFSDLDLLFKKLDKQGIYYSRPEWLEALYLPSMSGVKSSVTKQRKKLGMFADQLAETVESQYEKSRKERLEFHLKTIGDFMHRWTQNLKRLKLLPQTTRESILTEWNKKIYPGTPEYLADLITTTLRKNQI